MPELGAEFARGSIGEHRDDLHRRLRPELRRPSLEGHSQSRLQWELGHPSSGVGDEPIVVDQPERAEAPLGPRDGGLRERCRKIHAFTTRASPAGEGEQGIGEVRHEHLGRRLFGHPCPVLLREAAHGEPRAKPRGSACPLGRGGLRFPNRHEAAHSAELVEAWLARESRIDHDPHARHRQRRFRDGRRHDDAAAHVAQGVVLGTGIEPAVQRKHGQIEPRETCDHAVDFLHSRDEDEHRALLPARDGLMHRGGDMVEEGVVDSALTDGWCR